MISSSGAMIQSFNFFQALCIIFGELNTLVFRFERLELSW